MHSQQQDPNDLETPSKTSYANDTAAERFTDTVSLAVAAHDLGLLSSAIQAYKTAFHIAERCIVSLFSPTLQHGFLSRQDVLALPSRAASCAIQAGQLEVAVELLEQGRGQIWARLRDYSHPLSELLEASEDLGIRFRELCASLELLSMPGLGFLVSQEERSEYRKKKIDEWNELLKEIRNVDGLQGFLQPKTFAELRNAAENGPVIFINIDSSRSDAIIVQRAQAPCLVPLSQDLARIVPKLSKVVAHIKTRSLKPTTTKGYKGSLTNVAQDLWKHICEHVVAQLRALGFAEQSHIWWCPTNHLAALPIHAAGPYRDGEKNLLDLYVSSYTTSLLSLLRGQINKKECQSWVRRQVQLLAVGQSNALPKVKQELAVIQKTFAASVKILDGEGATQDVVEHELTVSSHNIVHFACHGFLDPVRPFDSYLELYLSKLSLKSLVGDTATCNQQIAFIAACHSAASEDGSSADEVITLAAAFQARGFQSVIGTLWEMADVDGPSLANDFYQNLLPDGGSARLHHAQDEHDKLTRALRYPSCTIEVLEAFHSLIKRNRDRHKARSPETAPPEDETPLEKAPEEEKEEEPKGTKKTFDLPRRLFRNLDKRPAWTDNDAPLPYLRHLFSTFKAGDDNCDRLGPDPNANQGYALTKAVHIKFIPLVRFLLEHGASPEPKDCLAVIVAIRQKNLPLVKMLIERQESSPSSSKKRRRLEDRVKPDVKMLKEAVRCKARDITEYLYHEKGVVPDMTTLQMMM
ncbi:hypothetical protein MD484_g5907, partial [Candolleomyces efflorescens]